MHIAVFGAGGIGGYFGGRLAKAGETVTFIARGAHLQAMHANGLSVESINGDFEVVPVQTTDDPSGVGEVDGVLVCVKMWQIPKAARAIMSMLGPDTFILPLENGVEAASQLAEMLGREHILGGICRIASRVSSPGHIQHTAIDPYIALGELDNRPSARTIKLLETVRNAGITAEIPADINVAIWLKFLFISAVSGVGAVTRLPVGGFRSLPGTRQMLVDVMHECYTVAIAQGIHLPADSPANTLAYIDSLPPDTMASMQRDILEGHPSELEAQNGALVHMGHALNIHTPANSFIYHSLLPQENLARSQSG